MARRRFTVNGELEIRDEDGNVIHQEYIKRDIWDDGGVYITYLKCLSYAKSVLLAAPKEHEIRKRTCRMCSTCERVISRD